MKTVSYDEGDVLKFAGVLVNSPDLDVMPPGVSGSAAKAVRAMGVKKGLPAKIVIEFGRAFRRGECNCGTCLVLRIHPDAKHPDPPERGLLYAAMTYLAATRGPQPGPCCDLMDPEEVQ